MKDFAYPNLFSPIKIAGVTFRNRIFASPTGYQDLAPGGRLTAEAVAYYERKAQGGAAAVTIGECAVDWEYGRGGLHNVNLCDPQAAHSLHKASNAVIRQGAVLSAELQHAGMFANREPGHEGPAFGPVEYEMNGKKIGAMDEAMIEAIIEKFADAALFAKRCGFGMVTVHGGHGWLLSQFISPALNTRRDKWGGPDIENRMRLPVAIADRIHRKCGAAFPVEMRISGSECYDGGYDIEEGIKIARQLDGHVDLIHVSAGSHEVDEVFSVTHPSMFLEDGCNVRFAAEIKKHVKTAVATVGALTDPALMEEIIASGQADVVEIARGLIAEPDLPLLSRTGREGEIRKCMRCLACFSTLMSEGQFYCAINPATGRELEHKSDIPPKVKKKVLVVGGGIGGMQAALTSAERGHEVILCEKTGRLGGALRCEEHVPFKEKLDAYLNGQERAVRKAAIDLRLNTAVTPELARALKADVIIAALGARPVRPNIPGIDGANVLGAEEAYLAPEKVGSTVAILGGGLVGLELGIHLAGLGRGVTIIEMADSLNDGGNFLHMSGVRVEIKRWGLDIHLSTKAMKITEEGVLCNGAEGEKMIPAETVIYAVGQRPLTEEAQALYASAPEFYALGDCVIPKNIMAANAQAHTIARNVGRI